MTTAEVVQPPGPEVLSGNSQSWPDRAVSMCGYISQMTEHSRGDLAELRRMNPEEPDAAAFWRLMAHHDLLDIGEDVERKWALIIHGIALMTPTTGSNTAHDRSRRVGQALYLGSESQRADAFYSETRLNRLLTSGGPMLRTLLRRMFRMLAAADATFDWQEMARFILNEGYDEEAAEQGRRRIAREYYREERRSSRSNAENN
ncbi:MAG: type I-E CRISPR-associated protein Cse2/CasB [Chloroflexi bacterium]|nr:type I-E CRISPR-associated protein Cse2/CasB [Chloroflexota bacterium]MYE39397.1 type I-E CRISPR-associated protein Cse2/CasB [Chloroflexota bacterium]